MNVYLDSNYATCTSDWNIFLFCLPKLFFGKRNRLFFPLFLCFSLTVSVVLFSFSDFPKQNRTTQKAISNKLNMLIPVKRPKFPPKFKSRIKFRITCLQEFRSHLINKKLSASYPRLPACRKMTPWRFWSFL